MNVQLSALDVIKLLRHDQATLISYENEYNRLLKDPIFKQLASHDVEALKEIVTDDNTVTDYITFVMIYNAFVLPVSKTDLK